MNKINATRIASFDVDPQKGFTPLCPNELPVPGGDQIVGDLNYMAKFAQLRVGSKDAHAPNALWVVSDKDGMLKGTGLPDADLTWVAHCVPGTPGFEFLDGLPDVKDYDFVVYKGIEPNMHPYGACYHDLSSTRSTGVIEFLRAEGVDTVIVGGLALDFCVATTALQLNAAGFTVVLYLPATRAISEAGGQAMVEQMKSVGVIVAATQSELASLIAA